MTTNLPIPSHEEGHLLSRWEQQYRAQWTPTSWNRVKEYLDQVPDHLRLDLVARFVQIDFEIGIGQGTRSVNDFDDDDDERIEPRLEFYLARYPELEKRWDLLSQIVVFEFAAHARRTHPLSIQHYIDLLPQHAEAIENLLERVESSLIRYSSPKRSRMLCGKSDTTRIPTDAPTTAAWQLPRILGRFYLFSYLDSGGMGTVFRAIDMQLGSIVAIKVMRRDDAWSVYQFNEEFRTLARIRHKNLVRLFDTFTDGDVRYFSMEMVVGSSLCRWAQERRSNPGFIPRVRHVFGQLASVINHLHVQEVIHRDIKPTNILVKIRDHVVLLDCGLALRTRAIHDPYEKDNKGPIGTLSYLAPERAAGEVGGPASDWYSLGVTLFEVLTGELPNDNVCENGTLSISQTIEKLAPDTTLDLRLLCESLLQKQPDRRPNGAEILRLLGQERRGTTLRSQRNAYPLVGRGIQLAELDNLICNNDQTQLPIGKKAALLFGGLGTGKSSIIDQWCGSLMQSATNTLLLRLQCYRQDQSPYRALNLLIQSVVDAARLQPNAPWNQILPHHAPPIVRHFPQLAHIAAVQNLDPCNSSVSYDQSIEALAKVLCELSHELRLVIAVDDMQYGDHYSTQFLLDNLCGRADFHGRIVASWTVENEDCSQPPPCLQTMGIPDLNCSWIHVPPLGRGDCQRLIQQWQLETGTVNEKRQNDIIDQSRGNVWLMRQLLEFVSSHLALDYDNEHSIPAIQKWHQAQLSQLPSLPLKILQYLAVSDGPISWLTIERTTRASPEAIRLALFQLEDEGWVRWTENLQTITIELLHDSLRTSIIQSMCSEKCKRRNLRLAQALIAQFDTPWHLVAEYLKKSGGMQRAAAAYFELARKAASRKAIDEARWAIDCISRLEVDLHKEFIEQVQDLQRKLELNS